MVQKMNSVQIYIWSRSFVISSFNSQKITILSILSIKRLLTLQTLEELLFSFWLFPIFFSRISVHI